MIEINDLEKHRKCRIWLDEKPEIYYKTTEIIEETFNANVFLNQNKHIAIEIKLPKNASYYGLLGVDFIPDNSGMTIVSVVVSACENDVFENHISYDFEKVICGILSDYGKSILNYIRENTGKINLPSGKLDFNIAAYGNIGSSCSVFELLTKIVIELLPIDFNDTEKIKQEVLNLI